jgi:hypothetical protein
MEFADVTKLRILSWKGEPGVFAVVFLLLGMQKEIRSIKRR